MNKLELVEHIATKAELTKVSAAQALEAVLDGIEKTLKKGEEVRLVGFGTFSVRERAAGKGRNPATGKEIKIAASRERALQARRGAEGSAQQEVGQEVTRSQPLAAAPHTRIARKSAPPINPFVGSGPCGRPAARGTVVIGLFRRGPDRRTRPALPYRLRRPCPLGGASASL